MENEIIKIPSIHFQLAQQIATHYAALPQVEAVAMSGSLGRGPGTNDSSSDIDFIFTLVKKFQLMYAGISWKKQAGPLDRISI